MEFDNKSTDSGKNKQLRGPDGTGKAITDKKPLQLDAQMITNLQRWNALLRDRPWAVNLKEMARDIAPKKFSISDMEKNELAEGLMIYFLDAFRRGDFADLNGIEKLGYLIENASFVPDKRFRDDLIFLYKNIGPFTMNSIFNEVVGTDGYTQMERRGESEKITMDRYDAALNKLLEGRLGGRKVDEHLISVFLNYSELLYNFHHGSPKLFDVSRETPELAVLMVVLSERLVGMKLPGMRESIGAYSEAGKMLEGIIGAPYVENGGHMAPVAFLEE